MQRVLCVLAALFCVAVFADEYSFAAGFGASNASCGKGMPTAWVAYNRDEAALSAHVRVRTGPDGGCAGQATAVDAEVSRRWPLAGRWGVSVTGGFDQRVTPFEFGCGAGDASCVELPGKLFRGVEVVTTSALVGVVYDAGPWSVELRYDGVEQDWEDGGGVPPVSLAYRHRVGPVDIDATLMARAVADVSVTFDRGRFRLSGSASHNAALLSHPAPPFVEAGGRRWARLGGPSTVYSLEAGVRF